MIDGLQQNPKLGYYQVGNQRFYSKPAAYIHGTAINVTPAWKFNELEYAKVNWTEEPEMDIREIYRLRAQQLRDKYDWIRVEASGGGDSTTAIYSFLLNGIHLDEVIFRYPKQGEKDVVDDPYNTSAKNTLSEFRYAAQPLLNWIKTNYPKTVVRIYDYTEPMLETENKRDESWVFNTQDWFQPGHADKHSNFHLKEHKILADSGKSICALYGIDKPKLTVLDGKWYTYFLDYWANHSNPLVGDYNITTELFYWTPDLPEIGVKQAHMVRRWFEMPQNFHLRHLVNWPNSDPAIRTAYEHIAKSIVYPDYDPETWQTAKPTNSFYNEMDHWFHVNFKDTRLYDTWAAGLQMLVDKIDHKYFTKQLGKPVGLTVNTTPMYYIGPATNTNLTPAMPNLDYIYANNNNSNDITTVNNKKLVKLNPRALRDK